MTDPLLPADEVLAVRADLGARERADVLEALGEPDALYPGGLTSPPTTVGDQLLAAALVGPWLACAGGWAVVVAAAETYRWVRRG